MNTRILLWKQGCAVAVLSGFAVIVAASLILEFLGWRIVDPDVPLRVVWSTGFLLGGLRTTGGAVAAGLLFVAAGFVVERILHRRVFRPVLLWWTGAASFLLVMAALVAWGP